MMKTGIICVLLCLLPAAILSQQDRPRAREFGISPGVFSPGPLNAITDVAGVKVGQITLIQDDDIRTGVTAVLPHSGNVFQYKVPAAFFAANGFGKLTGTTQLDELGRLETPVVLTNTLSVPTAADAVIDYILGLPENDSIMSVNPVVGETNDGYLNDIRGRHIKKEHVLEAIRNAASGPVEEGAVGAGTGTSCYGFKGGIGTASRKLPEKLGGYTVGVLVQTNHGGVLMIDGLPAGQFLEQYSYKRFLNENKEGSCMMVVATNAPLLSRNLKRLAKRALLGIARTGGYYSNGSGDYAIAFSTAEDVRQPYRGKNAAEQFTVLRNDRMSPLFLAAAEAAEEAILNSLFKAVDIKGRSGHVQKALPLDKIRELMKKHNYQ